MNLIEQEKLVRQAACLGISEKVCGYLVKPLTLVGYSALQVLQSPYLPPWRKPKPEETLQALWILSPLYCGPESPRFSSNRKAFMSQSFPFRRPLPPVLWRTRMAMARHAVACRRADEQHEIIVAELQDYILESFQDAPSGNGDAMETPEYYCDLIAVSTKLAREFGGGLEAYFDMPLKLALQALKEIKEHDALSEGRHPVLFNPSDIIADNELEKANRELHASGVKLHPDTISYLQRRQN